MRSTRTPYYHPDMANTCTHDMTGYDMLVPLFSSRLPELSLSPSLASQTSQASPKQMFPTQALSAGPLPAPGATPEKGVKCQG